MYTRKTVSGATIDDGLRSTNQLVCTHVIREPRSEERRRDRSGCRGTKSRPVQDEENDLHVMANVLADKLAVLESRRQDYFGR